MKQTTNITLSFPKHVIARMHKFVHKGRMSKFTMEAVTKALDELEKESEKALEAAYEAASQDKTRELNATEWMNLDNQEIEGWEWDDEG